MLRPGAGGTGAALRRTFPTAGRISARRCGLQLRGLPVKVGTGAGGGSNQFALRVARGPGPVGIGGRMASQRTYRCSPNMPAGGFGFHAVRLDSSAAGRTLECGRLRPRRALSAMRGRAAGPDAYRPIESCEVLGAVRARASPLSVSTTRSVSMPAGSASASPCPADTDVVTTLNPQPVGCGPNISTGRPSRHHNLGGDDDGRSVRLVN